MSPGPLIPTGNVVFKNGGTTLGKAALSNGVASINTVFSTAGAFSQTATYQGSGNYQGSSGSLVQSVQ